MVTLGVLALLCTGDIRISGLQLYRWLVLVKLLV